MKNKKVTLRILTVPAAALMVFGALAPLSAQARGRSTTVSGPRGGVYQRQVNHAPGRFSAADSVTLPNGRTASRSLATQLTDTGRTTSAQATGFNGRTVTYHSAGTATDTGYIRQATATRPDGATVVKQVAVSNQNGTVARTVTTSTTPPKS